MPNKLFEYMSAGLPVLSSNFSGWCSIVEGSRCGLCVDPYDINAICQAIQWMMEHVSEAKEMGQRGKVAVKQDYNWANEAQRLLNVYSEVL